MKKSLLIILFCTFVAHAQWVQMSNGIGNKEVEALAVTGIYVFAGTLSSTPSGVYLSTNNGTNWIQTTFNNQNVYSLTANGSNIFAGTAFPTNGVYRSTNNGTSWTQTTLNNQTIWSLAANENNIFAGAYGVYLSTNNGTSWTLTTLNNQTFTSLAVSGNNIFAGAVDYFPPHGVFISTNNGTSWTQIFNLRVSSLGANGNNIFAGTLDSGVYRSTNNGTNWTRTNLNTQVTSFAVNGNNIFAGSCCTGVYVSGNNGTSWTQRNEGLGNNTNINDLCILNNYIFAGTGAKGMGSVYRRPISELTGIQLISNNVPDKFSLSQNYPNPFNPTTIIRFSIPVGTGRDLSVQIKVFDVLGREVAAIVNEQLKPGTYEVDWPARTGGDGTNYSSGVYYYKLVSANFTETKKMILIK